MNSEPSLHELDFLSDTTVMVPVNEVLQNSHQAAALWPMEEQNNSLLSEQIETHTKRIHAIQEVVDNLPSPTINIESAVGTGLISEMSAIRLYSILGDILEDTDYQRLVLYLPFEFMPAESWKPSSDDLNHEVNRFKKTYLTAWHRLLAVHDVRANFIDGDVLEPSYRNGDLPRVVKAAHLLPALIDRGMLSKVEITELLQKADDPVLRQSIIEVLAGASHTATSGDSAEESLLEPLSDARKAWLAQKQHQDAITMAAQHITEAIMNNNLPPELIAESLATDGKELAPHALIEGIYNAIEATAMTDPDKTAALYDHYSEDLKALWKRDDSGITDRLTRVYRRLHRLKIGSAEQIADLGIDVPNLAGQLSENLSLFPEDISNLKAVTELIASHPELHEYIYPILTVAGSRLKGYGERNSDVDVCIFIRPGIPKSAQKQIQALLDSVLNNHDYRYEIAQFWLDEQNNQLRVHNFNERNNHIADSNWAHILFGAAWVGSEKHILDLQKRLLPAYFYQSDAEGSDQSERQKCLEIMEQDALQYRLMHSGYKRHFPRYSSSFSAPINDGSVFWDSGYRRLATQLFIEKVFLPKL